MRRRCLFLSLLLVLSVTADSALRSQLDPVPAAQSSNSFNLHVAATEVVLTFHVADASGRSIPDLQLDELGLYDNGRRPREVLAFDAMHDRPLRTGILLDRSDSMVEAASLGIASRYAREISRQQSDEGFVMKFASQSRTVQPWTRSAGDLLTAIRASANVTGRTRGTAMFDAVYRACFNEFSHVDDKGSGNLLLLFSDGEDNASRASLSDAMRACQQTNTAIYVFRPELDTSSSGLTTLRELAERSEGAVVRADGSAQEILFDLQMIDADLRNQYRLIYRPFDLNHDGAFHTVVLIPPKRVSTVSVRSGYYAPVR